MAHRCDTRSDLRDLIPGLSINRSDAAIKSIGSSVRPNIGYLPSNVQQLLTALRYHRCSVVSSGSFHSPVRAVLCVPRSPKTVATALFPTPGSTHWMRIRFHWGSDPGGSPHLTKVSVRSVQTQVGPCSQPCCSPPAVPPGGAALKVLADRRLKACWCCSLGVTGAPVDPAPQDGLSPKMISAGCRSASWEVESTSFYSHTYSVRVFISISWSWGKGTYSALTPGYSTSTPMACAPRHLQRHEALEPGLSRRDVGNPHWGQRGQTLSFFLFLI